MNFPLLSLELRKNRLSAVSVAAAFLVTLPVSRLVASSTGMESARAFEAILFGWLLFGTPFAAALIAASAGAQTGSAGSREAEALYPASPARRAAASILAAALLLAAVAALLFGAAYLSGALAPYLSPRDQVMNWGRPFWERAPTVSFFLFVLTDALLASWILSYLLGHGVAGGLIGLALTTFTLFIAGVACGLEIEHTGWNVRVLPWLAALGAASIAAKAVAAARAAAWRERSARLGATGAALLAGLVLLGPLAGTWYVNRTYAAVIKLVHFSEPEAVFDYQAWSERAPASPAALAASGREAAATSARGGLYAAGPDGIRVLIPEETGGVVDFVMRPFERATIRFAERDERGILWAQRKVEPNTELWKQNGSEMSMARRYPDRGWSTPDRRARRLLIQRWNNDTRESDYASIDDYVLRGEKAVFESFVATLRRGEKEADVARVGCAPADDCLKHGGTTWRLPGTAVSRQPSYPHWVGGKPAYLIRTTTKRGLAAVLCRPGGRVEHAWLLREKYDRFYGLPTGALYAYEPGDAMGIIDADGKVAGLRYGRLRPKGAAADSKPALVRREPGRSWLLWSGHLISVDAEGRPLDSTYLMPVENFRVLEKGLLLDGGKGLFFRGWDGTLRPLEKPAA